MNAGRRAAAVAAAAGALVACSVPPATVGRPVDAAPRTGDVVLSGGFQSAAGQPLVGRPVVVTRRESGGDLAGDLFLTALSAGLLTLSCVTGPQSAIESCRTRGFTTTTDAGGRWAERLRRADVRGRFGLRTLVVSTGVRPAPGELSGAAVWVSAFPGHPTIALPVVRLWRPHVRGSGDAATFRLDFDRPPRPAARLTVELSSTTRGLDLTDDAASRPETLDARLLEDVVARASVTARDRVGGHDVAWLAPTVLVRGTAGAPPSRGASCDDGGRGGSVAGHSCWLTDGQFATPAPSPAPRSAVVDLGKALPVALIVLRANGAGSNRGGAVSEPPDTLVEGSADGRTWAQLGTVPGAALAGSRAVEEVVPPVATTVRYVRLSAGGAEQQASLAALTEMSVWRGRPASGPAVRPAHLRVSAPHRHGVDSPVLVAVAGVLLGAAAAAWLALRRRRSSRPVGATQT